MKKLIPILITLTTGLILFSSCQKEEEEFSAINATELINRSFQVLDLATAKNTILDPNWHQENPTKPECQIAISFKDTSGILVYQVKEVGSQDWKRQEFKFYFFASQKNENLTLSFSHQDTLVIDEHRLVPLENYSGLYALNGQVSWKWPDAWGLVKCNTHTQSVITIIPEN